MKINCSLLIASNLLGANAWVPFSFKRRNMVSFATIPNKDIDPATGKNTQNIPKIGLNTNVDIEAKAELRVEPAVEKLAEENVERETEAKINAEYHSGVAPQVLSEAIPASSSTTPVPAQVQVPAPKKKKALTPEQIRALERAAELKVEAAMEAKVEKAAEQAVEKLMERSVEVELTMATEQSFSIPPQTQTQPLAQQSTVEVEPQTLPEAQIQASATPAVVEQQPTDITASASAPIEAADVNVPPAPASPAEPISPEGKERAAETMLTTKNTETMLNDLAEEAVEAKIESAVEKVAEKAAEKVVSETYGHVVPVEKNVETSLKGVSDLKEKEKADLTPQMSLAEKKVEEEAEQKIMSDLKAIEAQQSKKAYLAHRALLIRRLEIEASARAKNSSTKELVHDVASLAKGDTPVDTDAEDEEQNALLKRAAELIARDVPLRPDSLTEKYAAIESLEERAYQILVDLGMVIVHPDPDSPDYDHSTDDEIVPEGEWV